MTKRKSHPRPKTVRLPVPAPVPAATPRGIPDDSASLDREIALLRDLIRQAGKKQNDSLELDEQLELLESVGRTAPALARLLKARRDLANEELDPAALLRQALLELEQEWPELKKFGEQFKQ